MKLVITTLSVLVTAYILPGVDVKDIFTALVLSIVLAVLNVFVKPLLLLFTLPLTVITFGLFLFVINAFVVLLAAELVPGVVIDGFWWAVLFSIILSLVVAALESLQGGSDDNRSYR